MAPVYHRPTGLPQFGALGRVVPLLPSCETGAVVHGGDDRQTRTAGEAVPLADFSRLLARFDEAA